MRAAMLAGSGFQCVDAWPSGMRLRCGRPWIPAFAGMTVKGTTGSRSVASNPTAVRIGLDAEIEAMAPGTMRPLQALPTLARRAGCAVGGEGRAEFEDLGTGAPVLVGRAGFRIGQVECDARACIHRCEVAGQAAFRSEEHTSALQSQMPIS